MDSKSLITFTAILFGLYSPLPASPNSWSAYSDGSSFRDVLQGRSYEEAFGDYDSMFSSSLNGGSYGGGGGSGSSYGTQERNPIKVTQQRSGESDYGSGPKYVSPAVTVRSGQRSSYGSQSPQSSYGNKGYSQSTKPSQTAKGGYSGVSKPSYGSTSPKTTQQTYDSDYDSSGGISEIPDTGFQCLNRYYGYYADVNAGCQIFHVCQPDGQKWSFYCPNGTLYHQKVQTCDWWYNVDCSSSTDYYFLNERIGVLPPQDATLQRF